MYRKKHGIDKKTKIFIIKGYGSLKKALLERGWNENIDANSRIFHLKFAVKKESLFKGAGPRMAALYNAQSSSDNVSSNLYDF